MIKYPLVMSEQWSIISCRGLRKNEALDCKVSQMTSIFLYRLDLWLENFHGIEVHWLKISSIGIMNDPNNA